MKHKEIKITLKKRRDSIKSTDLYQITKLQGAINVDSRKRTNLSVGATLGNDEAIELNTYYSVTVIQ